MNLREVLRSLDSNLKKYFIKRINEGPDAYRFKQNIHGNYLNGYSSDDDYWIGKMPLLATDHATTILTREEVLELLKEEEYTLDKLPEKWFVEYSDDIDRELLFKKKKNRRYYSLSLEILWNR